MMILSLQDFKVYSFSHPRVNESQRSSAAEKKQADRVKPNMAEKVRFRYFENFLANSPRFTDKVSNGYTQLQRNYARKSVVTVHFGTNRCKDTERERNRIILRF